VCTSDPSSSVDGARARIELGDIVREHSEGTVAGRGASASQQAVLRALAQCRTAALGGHLEACDHCEHRRAVYHSCRNRHCPKCQTMAAADWLEARRADLLPVDYFHVVFTLPHELCPLALQRPRVVYDLLFRAASETLATFGRDPRFFEGSVGGTLGVTAILHTWGQNLSLHPHLHCVVTGGGLSQGGQHFVRPRHPGFLFPVRALAKVFRGKFLDGLRKAFEAGDLGDDPRTPALCASLRRIDWVVYAKPPFAGPEQVLAYLGRYTHRIAISNHRILGLEDGKVAFRYRDYRDGDRQKVLRLSVHEFLRRFLLHVLPKRFVRIRHYGLLANRHRAEKLARCRALLDVAEPGERPRECAHEKLHRLTGIDPLRCPACKQGRMVEVAEIPRPARRRLPHIRAPVREAA
jgi:hypothetical protein